MTIDDLIKKINGVERKLPRVVELSARTSMSMMVTRIFTDGLNTRNSTIGQYSTKPIYVPHDRAPRSKKGSRGKTGRADQTYFAGGYKEFSKKMGRTSKVNLQLFGSLMRDFAGADVVEGKNYTRIPSQMKPTKFNDLTYGVVLKNDFNIKKRVELEKKYGEVFSPTREEAETFRDTIVFELNKLL